MTMTDNCKDMKYIIVMPAFNEQDNIRKALESLVVQTLLPTRLIVVNDGSTDDTAGIVEEYAGRYPWIRMIHRKGEAYHSPGGKIVRAFYTGFNTIEEDFDFVVKLDADQVLPENYFARVAQMFEEDPKLGIAGGISVVERNGKWIYEGYSDKDHVRGPHKSYRKACFEAIGGLRPSVGWDSVDEMLANLHGWHFRTDENLKIKHLRARGTSTGYVKVMLKIGRAMYRMRYGFLITLVSAAKAGALNRPYVLTGLAVMLGWFRSLFSGDAYIVNREEGKFIRRFRWQRMKAKIIKPRE